MTTEFRDITPLLSMMYRNSRLGKLERWILAHAWAKEQYRFRKLLPRNWTYFVEDPRGDYDQDIKFNPLRLCLTEQEILANYPRFRLKRKRKHPHLFANPRKVNIAKTSLKQSLNRLQRKALVEVNHEAIPCSSRLVRHQMFTPNRDQFGWDEGTHIINISRHSFHEKYIILPAEAEDVAQNAYHIIYP